jgi:hypothetical protein
MLRDLTHRTQTASLQYITLFALPFDLNVHAPVRLPRHLHLDLSRLVLPDFRAIRRAPLLATFELRCSKHASKS